MGAANWFGGKRDPGKIKFILNESPNGSLTYTFNSCNVSQTAKKKIWRPSIIKGEKNGIEVSDMIIDLSSDFFPNNNFQDGRFVYRFVHQLSHETHPQAQNEKSSAVNKLSERNLDCSLKAGDYVVRALLIFYWLLC